MALIRQWIEQADRVYVGLATRINRSMGSEVAARISSNHCRQRTRGARDDGTRADLPAVRYADHGQRRERILGRPANVAPLTPGPGRYMREVYSHNPGSPPGPGLEMRYRPYPGGPVFVLSPVPEARIEDRARTLGSSWGSRAPGSGRISARGGSVRIGRPTRTTLERETVNVWQASPGRYADTRPAARRYRPRCPMKRAEALILATLPPRPRDSLPLPI